MQWKNPSLFPLKTIFFGSRVAAFMREIDSPEPGRSTYQFGSQARE